MTYPIVGLMGAKRSGKDTFASFLVESHGYKRFAFADPLKEAALHLDPYVRQQSLGDGAFIMARLSDVVRLLGWESAKEIPEVRRTLQEFGIGVRAIDPDFWLRATMTPALAHAAEQGPVVITDVRFPNEAEAIGEARGWLVRVLRPGTGGDDPHVSETALRMYPADYYAHNDGPLVSLEKAAARVAQAVEHYSPRQP